MSDAGIFYCMSGLVKLHHWWGLTLVMSLWCCVVLAVCRLLMPPPVIHILARDSPTSVGWLDVEFYVLATFMVPTCDNAHSWQLFSAALLGEWATSTMTLYHTKSYYLDTEPTSPCPILIMPSTWLGSDKYQFLSHWLDSTRVWTYGFESRDLRKL